MIFLHSTRGINFLEELRSRGLASMFLALWCPAYGITGAVILKILGFFWLEKGGWFFGVVEWVGD